MPSSPQPRRRARTAGENATAATQPAVHRAHSAPAPRSAGRLIQVTTTASEEDAAGAPKLGFLPRVSIRLDRRAGGANVLASHGGDAARPAVIRVPADRQRDLASGGASWAAAHESEVGLAGAAERELALEVSE